MTLTAELHDGDVVKGLRSGTEWRVTHRLGEGGAGVVYAAVAPDGTRCAVKLFRDSYLQTDPDVEVRLHRFTDEDPPSPAFVWPREAVNRNDGDAPSLGYLTELVEGAVAANRLFQVNGTGTGPSLEVRATAAIELADAVSLLGLKGYVHKDLSGTNVLVDPDEGSVRIIDWEMCDVEGSAQVVGTPGYQAVESVRDHAPQSRQSDLHSLAVLIFEILLGSHPLRGERFWSLPFPNDDDLDEVFVRDPVFVFDPDDRRNRALTAQDDPYNECGGLASVWWPVYPAYLQRLFRRAFTTAMGDPGQRVQATMWLGAVLRFRDSLAPCPKCGNLNSLDVLLDGASHMGCWSCQYAGEQVPRLVVGGHLVALRPEGVVSAHRVGIRSFDWKTPVFEVTQHPESGEPMLANASAVPAVLTSPVGETRQIRQGQAIPVKGLPHGTLIRLGRYEAMVARHSEN